MIHRPADDRAHATCRGAAASRRLMAAMAQLDCGQCGYYCQTSRRRSLRANRETRLGRCVPGGQRDRADAEVAERSSSGRCAGTVAAAPAVTGRTAVGAGRGRATIRRGDLLLAPTTQQAGLRERSAARRPRSSTASASTMTSATPRRRRGERPKLVAATAAGSAPRRGTARCLDGIARPLPRRSPVRPRVAPAATSVSIALLHRPCVDDAGKAKPKALARRVRIRTTISPRSTCSICSPLCGQVRVAPARKRVIEAAAAAAAPALFDLVVVNGRQAGEIAPSVARRCAAPSRPRRGWASPRPSLPTASRSARQVKVYMQVRRTASACRRTTRPSS